MNIFLRLKIKKFIGLILIIIVLLILLLSNPLNAKAFAPFGGIIKSFYCPCSNNYMITVGPPVPGVFMFEPGTSVLHPFFNIYRSGVWALGIASGFSTCWVPVTKGCAPVGSGMVIIRVGTSF